MRANQTAKYYKSTPSDAPPHASHTPTGLLHGEGEGETGQWIVDPSNYGDPCAHALAGILAQTHRALAVR